jgi:hypothetical protein
MCGANRVDAFYSKCVSAAHSSHQADLTGRTTIMLRRLLLASVLFGILGSGSGCCLLERLIHCEKYCGPSCGPKYWGPYHTEGCDPCDRCGNYVGSGDPHSPDCGCGSHGSGHYDGGYSGGGHDGGGHYDGEIIYEGPVRDTAAYEDAAYEGRVHGRVTNVNYRDDAPKRQVPLSWRLP